MKMKRLVAKLVPRLRRMESFLKDDRGQAMTEYALILGITVPLCAWLWHPNNHFFNGMRRLYTRMKMVIMLPGP